MARGTYGSQNGRDKSARKQGSVGATYDAAFRGFINLDVTSEQKAAFDAWCESASVWEALEAFVADGVNISIKLDHKSEGFLGSATQRRANSPNAGLVVTARAGTASKALLRTIFCLVILSHRERWEDTKPVADPDRW